MTRDLVCLHAGIAVENVSLRGDDVLQRVRALLDTPESDGARDAGVRNVGDLRIDPGPVAYRASRRCGVRFTLVTVARRPWT